MAGNKNSGRKPKSLNRADAQRRMTQLLPSAVDTIGHTAEGANTDRLRYEAAKDIYEHCMGKAKQQTDLNVTGGEDIAIITLVAIAKAGQERRLELEEARIKLLGEGDAPIKTEGQEKEAESTE